MGIELWGEGAESCKIMFLGDISYSLFQTLAVGCII